VERVSVSGEIGKIQRKDAKRQGRKEEQKEVCPQITQKGAD